MQKSLIDYPKRGEIYIADLEPGFGREIRKKRPVLIISNNNLNKGTPFVVVIPTSSIVPQTVNPEMVVLGKLKGLKKKSLLLPLFVRSIDKDRLIKKVGKISKHKLLEVEEAIKLVLGLIDKDFDV